MTSRRQPKPFFMMSFQKGLVIVVMMMMMMSSGVLMKTTAPDLYGVIGDSEGDSDSHLIFSLDQSVGNSQLSSEENPEDEYPESSLCCSSEENSNDDQVAYEALINSEYKSDNGSKSDQATESKSSSSDSQDIDDNSFSKTFGKDKRRSKYDPAFRLMGLGKRIRVHNPNFKFASSYEKELNVIPVAGFVSGKRKFKYSSPFKSAVFGGRGNPYDPALKLMGLGKRVTNYDPALMFMGVGKRKNSFEFSFPLSRRRMRSSEYDPSLKFMGLGKRKPGYDPALRLMGLGKRKQVYDPALRLMGLGKRKQGYDPALRLMGLGKRVKNYDPALKFMGLGKRIKSYDPALKFMGLGKRAKSYDPALNFMGLGKRKQDLNSSMKFLSFGNDQFDYNPALKVIALGNKKIIYDPNLENSDLDKRASSYDPAFKFMGLGKRGASFDPALKFMGLGKRGSNYDPALNFLGLGKRASSYDPALRFMGLGRRGSSYDPAFKFAGLGKRDFSYDSLFASTGFGAMNQTDENAVDTSETTLYNHDQPLNIDDRDKQYVENSQSKNKYYDPTKEQNSEYDLAFLTNPYTETSEKSKRSFQRASSFGFLNLVKPSVFHNPRLLLTEYRNPRSAYMNAQSEYMYPQSEFIKPKSEDKANLPTGLVGFGTRYRKFSGKRIRDHGKRQRVYDPALKYMGLGKRKLNFSVHENNPALKYINKKTEKIETKEIVDEEQKPHVRSRRSLPQSESDETFGNVVYFADDVDDKLSNATDLYYQLLTEGPTKQHVDKKHNWDNSYDLDPNLESLPFLDKGRNNELVKYPGEEKVVYTMCTTKYNPLKQATTDKKELANLIQLMKIFKSSDSLEDLLSTLTENPVNYANHIKRKLMNNPKFDPGWKFLGLGKRLFNLNLCLNFLEDKVPGKSVSGDDTDKHQDPPKSLNHKSFSMDKDDPFYKLFKYFKPGVLRKEKFKGESNDIEYPSKGEIYIKSEEKDGGWKIADQPKWETKTVWI